MDSRKEAVKFFKEEVRQFELMMEGVMNPPYRKYIENLKRYYEMAIDAIQKDVE